MKRGLLRVVWRWSHWLVWVLLGGPVRLVVQRVWRLVPCRVVLGVWPMHRWIHVNGAQIGLCERCQGFYRLGRYGRVLERITDSPEEVTRALRRQMGRGLPGHGKRGGGDREGGTEGSGVEGGSDDVGGHASSGGGTGRSGVRTAGCESAEGGAVVGEGVAVVERGS